MNPQEASSTNSLQGPAVLTRLGALAQQACVASRLAHRVLPPCVKGPPHAPKRAQLVLRSVCCWSLPVTQRSMLPLEPLYADGP